MSTDKQLRANRANAARSTGPRTDGGKAISRYNALKHGLAGAKVVMPGENPDEYSAFHQRLMSEFAPLSTVEEDLVDKVAATLWRLRRVPFLETAFFAYSQHKRLWDSDYLLDPILELSGVPADLHEKVWAPWKPEDRDTLKTVGRIVEDALSANVLSKLSMYEARLLRQVERLLGQLERLRDRRAEIPADDEYEAPTIDGASDALNFDPEALASFALSS